MVQFKKQTNKTQQQQDDKQKTPKKENLGNTIVLWQLSLVKVTLPLNLLVLKLSNGSYPQNNICVCNSVQHFGFIHWKLVNVSSLFKCYTATAFPAGHSWASGNPLRQQRTVQVTGLKPQLTPNKMQ